MTPLFLQDRLVDELTKLFEGKTLKNENGDESAFKICAQYLPAEDPSVEDQTEITYFPFVRVILDSGSDPGVEEARTCDIRFEAGVYDSDSTYQGHRDLMNIIGEIYRHFIQRRCFGVFEINYPFRWSIDPENTYPKFYGMIETTWNLPKVTINDPLT